nr:hypothetical protein [Tanacetum cinerariifolium]
MTKQPIRNVGGPVAAPPVGGHGGGVMGAPSVVGGPEAMWLLGLIGGTAMLVTSDPRDSLSCRVSIKPNYKFDSEICRLSSLSFHSWLIFREHFAKLDERNKLIDCSGMFCIPVTDFDFRCGLCVFVKILILDLGYSLRDGDDESVGTSTARVILFSTIPTTILSTVPTTDLPVISVAKQDFLLETSLDSYSDTSSYSSLRHSPSGYALLDSLCNSLTATSARPSRKRCMSPAALVYVALPVREAVSSNEGYMPYVPREVALGVDVEDNYEPYTEPDVDSDIQVDIDTCIAFADDLKAIGTDVISMVKTAAKEEVESSVRGTIEVVVDPRVRLVINDDVRESVWEDVPGHVTTDGSVEITYDTLRDLNDPTCNQRGDCQHVKEALKAYDTTKNPKTETEIENEQQNDNFDTNGNNENGNENVNGNPNANNGGVVPVAQECTYQDFVKCQLLNFKGTEGELMKLMTEVYCPRNVIKKMKTELWNLIVKGKEDKVDKYIGGLPDSIQRNVIAAKPVRLQDAICIANSLIDLKLKGYAIKNAKSKRRDCRTAVVATPQRAPVRNQPGNAFYKCRRQGHYRNKYPRLRNQNHGNKNGNNEAKTRAYAIGGAEANPDSNVVTRKLSYVKLKNVIGNVPTSD